MNLKKLDALPMVLFDNPKGKFYRYEKTGELVSINDYAKLTPRLKAFCIRTDIMIVSHGKSYKAGRCVLDDVRISEMTKKPTRWEMHCKLLLNIGDNGERYNVVNGRYNTNCVPVGNGEYATLAFTDYKPIRDKDGRHVSKYELRKDVTKEQMKKGHYVTYVATTLLIVASSMTLPRTHRLFKKDVDYLIKLVNGLDKRGKRNPKKKTTFIPLK